MTIEQAHKSIERRRKSHKEWIEEKIKSFKQDIALTDDMYYIKKYAEHIIDDFKSYEEKMRQFEIEENVLISLEVEKEGE